ncbi:MAG: response regulator [Flavobacteriaceae bacterium]|nr:response regulator [Flavobacteriaceae bacterium]
MIIFLGLSSFDNPNNLSEIVSNKILWAKPITIETQVFEQNLLKNSQDKFLEQKSSIYNGIFIFLLFSLCVFTFFLHQTNKKNQKLNSLLIKKKKLIKQYTEEKFRLFSSVSHELKTPLYALLGLTELLTNKESIDNEDIESLRLSSMQLLFLIDNVLNANRIQHKQLRLEDELFNLRELTQNLISSFKFMAKKSKKSISYDMDFRCEKLIGDSNKLHEILNNLLDNALRNSKNEIKLSIKQINDPLELPRYVFRISGDGLKKINQKIEKKISLNNISGIRLYIVENVLKLYNSKTILQNEKNNCSSFTLSFKKQEDCCSEQQIAPLPCTTKVLIVDDNKLNLIIAKRLLEKNGYCGFTAKDLDTLLVNLAEEQIDLILMDINMPEKNGYELTKIIRGFSDVPIIAHTAVIKKNTRKKALASGMNDLIEKPYETAALLQKINAVLERETQFKLKTLIENEAISQN